MLGRSFLSFVPLVGTWDFFGFTAFADTFFSVVFTGDVFVTVFAAVFGLSDSLLLARIRTTFESLGVLVFLDTFLVFLATGSPTLYNLNSLLVAGCQYSSIGMNIYIVKSEPPHVAFKRHWV